MSDLRAEIAAHDDLIALRSLQISLGAEPTFTRRDSDDAAWLTQAEGSDKEIRAFAMARFLAEATGGSVGRALGRSYPGEANPRFCYSVHPLEIDAAPSADVPPPTGVITITPDPGVIEVNMAPCETLAEFAAQLQAIYRAADRAELSPVRYRFNGDITESGGGGQLTLGGMAPLSSPFLRYPHTLPALIRYVNNHPALSYFFASDCVGSASQAPRPDEGSRERYAELSLALRWLEHQADEAPLAPSALWQGLAPFLVDAAGNSHRAELNIEKLWNPNLAMHGGRSGTMGVVEFRAVRMAAEPTMLIALAALFRSVVARCAIAHYREPLVEWGDDLHDRFALPALLEQDLRRVLGDLDAHNFPLLPTMRAALFSFRDAGILCQQHGVQLSLRRALEFWPLVGDVASQEQAGARWVDSSTERWQIAVEGAMPDELVVAGRRCQLQRVEDQLAVIGVRRRAFAPAPGLHPTMPVLDPLVIDWRVGASWQRVELFHWQPSGGPYPGPPATAEVAAQRRYERVRISHGITPDVVGTWQVRGITVDTRLP